MSSTPPKSALHFSCSNCANVKNTFVEAIKRKAHTDVAIQASSVYLAPSVSNFSLSALLKINCGLIGGVAQAGLFNPWDRALYLSVVNDRPFLSSLNFKNPYQGFSQAIVQRTLSNGLYFPLEDLFMVVCAKLLGGSTHFSVFLAGTLAGAVNGICLNPASAVKYHTWGHEPRSFFSTAKVMFREGGLRPFMKGTTATIMRDATFGGTYSLLRNRILVGIKELDTSGQPHRSTKMETFLVNFCAAGVATVVSGPFNYVRNIKYAIPADMSPPSTMNIFANLWKDVKSRTTFSDRFDLLQARLRLGWGTARVAIGMAFTSQVYELCTKTTPTP